MNAISTSSLRVLDLRCEYQLNPLGIDSIGPRLSWKLASDQRNASQSAYQIQVSDGQGDRWDSGEVLSEQTLHIPYRGPALRSRQRCIWRVRVWDERDRPSTWSEPGWWEMGLLGPADWQASWIEPDWEEDPASSNPCPYVRTTFALREQVIAARVYVTAHGLYELSLNGQRVGDTYFTPGYTSYHHRLQYQVYDVGDLLQVGENALGVILGDGWYRGEIGIFSHRNVYGERLGLLLQLHLIYADGSEQFICSDRQWKASTGPILKSDLKEGECYDARLEMPGWNRAHFDDSLWQGVRVVGYRLENLVATVGPAVRQQAQNKYDPGGYTPPRYLEREPLSHERYLWDTNFHWGEWLEPNDPLPGMINAEWTPETCQLLSAPHIATAFFARSARLLAEAAQVLGKEDDAQEYRALHQRVKEAYIAEFVGDDGRLWPDRQASYVRALAFDLLPEHLRASAVQRLVELVQSAGTHLGTGFLSTPYLCPVLGENGHLDLGYALLMQDTPPSWLYAVKKEATTIWESWDGIDEEGNPHHSLNHYAYGAIGNWLYQVVAGIVPGAPGYRHTMFQPQPGGGLTLASSTYQSLYGEIATSWQMDGERFRLTVTVPTNTTATVVIPTRLGGRITEGGVALSSAEGIRGLRSEQKATTIEIGSGTYTFTAVHDS